MNEFVRRPSRRRDNRVYVPAADIIKRTIRRSWTISNPTPRWNLLRGSPELRPYNSLPRGQDISDYPTLALHQQQTNLRNNKPEQRQKLPEGPPGFDGNTGAALKMIVDDSSKRMHSPARRTQSEDVYSERTGFEGDPQRNSTTGLTGINEDRGPQNTSTPVPSNKRPVRVNPLMRLASDMQNTTNKSKSPRRKSSSAQSQQNTDSASSPKNSETDDSTSADSSVVNPRKSSEKTSATGAAEKRVSFDSNVTGKSGEQYYKSSPVLRTRSLIEQGSPKNRGLSQRSKTEEGQPQGLRAEEQHGGELQDSSGENPQSIHNSSKEETVTGPVELCDIEPISGTVFRKVTVRRRRQDMRKIPAVDTGWRRGPGPETDLLDILLPEGDDYKLVFISSDSSSKEEDVDDNDSSSTASSFPIDECDWDYFEPGASANKSSSASSVINWSSSPFGSPRVYRRSGVLESPLGSPLVYRRNNLRESDTGTDEDTTRLDSGSLSSSDGLFPNSRVRESSSSAAAAEEILLVDNENTTSSSKMMIEEMLVKKCMHQIDNTSSSSTSSSSAGIGSGDHHPTARRLQSCQSCGAPTQYIPIPVPVPIPFPVPTTVWPHQDTVLLYNNAIHQQPQQTVMETSSSASSSRVRVSSRNLWSYMSQAALIWPLISHSPKMDTTTTTTGESTAGSSNQHQKTNSGALEHQQTAASAARPISPNSSNNNTTSSERDAEVESNNTTTTTAFVVMPTKVVSPREIVVGSTSSNEDEEAPHRGDHDDLDLEKSQSASAAVSDEAVPNHDLVLDEKVEEEEEDFVKRGTADAAAASAGADRDRNDYIVPTAVFIAEPSVVLPLAAEVLVDHHQSTVVSHLQQPGTLDVVDQSQQTQRSPVVVLLVPPHHFISGEVVKSTLTDQPFEETADSTSLPAASNGDDRLAQEESQQEHDLPLAATVADENAEELQGYLQSENYYDSSDSSRDTSSSSSSDESDNNTAGDNNSRLRHDHTGAAAKKPPRMHRLYNVNGTAGGGNSGRRDSDVTSDLNNSESNSDLTSDEDHKGNSDREGRESRNSSVREEMSTSTTSSSGGSADTDSDDTGTVADKKPKRFSRTFVVNKNNSDTSSNEGSKRHSSSSSDADSSDNDTDTEMDCTVILKTIKHFNEENLTYGNQEKPEENCSDNDNETSTLRNENDDSKLDCDSETKNKDDERAIFNENSNNNDNNYDDNNCSLQQIIAESSNIARIIDNDSSSPGLSDVSAESLNSSDVEQTPDAGYSNNDPLAKKDRNSRTYMPLEPPEDSNLSLRDILGSGCQERTILDQIDENSAEDDEILQASPNRVQQGSCPEESSQSSSEERKIDENPLQGDVEANKDLRTSSTSVQENSTEQSDVDALDKSGGVCGNSPKELDEAAQHLHTAREGSPEQSDDIAQDSSSGISENSCTKLNETDRNALADRSEDLQEASDISETLPDQAADKTNETTIDEQSEESLESPKTSDEFVERSAQNSVEPSPNAIEFCDDLDNRADVTEKSEESHKLHESADELAEESAKNSDVEKKSKAEHLASEKPPSSTSTDHNAPRHTHTSAAVVHSSTKTSKSGGETSEWKAAGRRSKKRNNKNNSSTTTKAENNVGIRSVSYTVEVERADEQQVGETAGDHHLLVLSNTREVEPRTGVLISSLPAAVITGEPSVEDVHDDVDKNSVQQTEQNSTQNNNDVENVDETGENTASEQSTSLSSAQNNNNNNNVNGNSTRYTSLVMITQEPPPQQISLETLQKCSSSSLSSSPTSSSCDSNNSSVCSISDLKKQQTSSPDFTTSPAKQDSSLVVSSSSANQSPLPSEVSSRSVCTQSAYQRKPKEQQQQVNVVTSDTTTLVPDTDTTGSGNNDVVVRHTNSWQDSRMSRRNNVDSQDRNQEKEGKEDREMQQRPTMTAAENPTIESSVTVITGDATLSAFEEGLADDDSWVENLSHDDDEDEDEDDDFGTTSPTSDESTSGEEVTLTCTAAALMDQEDELRGYHRAAIDFTLHTIVEESCEESELEHPSLAQFGHHDKSKNSPNPALPVTELEKYFFFRLGDGTSHSLISQQRSEEAFSESSSICSEALDSLGQTSEENGSNSVQNSDVINGSDLVELASSRLEKYFLSGFMGFTASERRDSDGSVGSDSEGKPSPEQRRKRLVRARGTGRSHSSSLDNLLTNPDLASSASGGGNSSAGELQQSSDSLAQKNSENSSSSSDSDSSSEDEANNFEKSDGQFDTVKRTGGNKNKNKKSQPTNKTSLTEESVNSSSSNNKQNSDSCQQDSNDSVSCMLKIEQADQSEDDDDSEGHKTPQPDSMMNLTPTNLTTNKNQQSRDSGFVGSCDDLLKDSSLNSKEPGSELAPNSNSQNDTTSGNAGSVIKPDLKINLENIAEEKKMAADGRYTPLSTPPATSLTRKDSFNNWSSDEETNLMMCKMRQFFKTMVANSQCNSNSKPTTPVLNQSRASPKPSVSASVSSASASVSAVSNIPQQLQTPQQAVSKHPPRCKPPQLVYFENELTRLMKTVPGIRDDQVREIVEYLSSEDTWSDSYDSSDYTSSDLDLEGHAGLINAKKSVLQQQISDSCKQIINKFDNNNSASNIEDEEGDEGDGGIVDMEGQLQTGGGLNRETAFVYQKLVQSFEKMATGDDPAGSSQTTKLSTCTPHSSPPLIAKVMHHIGSRLVALMHEVSSGESHASSNSPKNRHYHRRLQQKLSNASTISSTTTTTDDDESTSDSNLPPDNSALTRENLERNDLVAYNLLPRSRSHDLLTGESKTHHHQNQSISVSDIAEERGEASDCERFSWRGSFESALLATDSSRNKLSLLSGENSASASALASAMAAAKRRSAGDLLFGHKSLSREQLDRVRSCGSIGGASSGNNEDKLVWVTTTTAAQRPSRRRSSVPDATSGGGSGGSADGEDADEDSDPENLTISSLSSPNSRSTTLPRSLQTGTATTNSLPRLPTSSSSSSTPTNPNNSGSTGILSSIGGSSGGNLNSTANMGTTGSSTTGSTFMQKAQSMYHFLPPSAKSARYRPPGFGSASGGGNSATTVNQRLFGSGSGGGVVPKRAVSAPGLQHIHSSSGGGTSSSTAVHQRRGRRSQQHQHNTSSGGNSNVPNNGDDVSISEAHSSPMLASSRNGSKSASPSPIASSARRGTGSLSSQDWSNVTADDDIDRLVVMHQTRSSLSSLGLRSDSMASVYSGAGEGRYGTVTVRGQVEFGLQYNYKASALEILIKQCKDLAAVDTKRNRSDPYVKVYLLPDKSKSGKRKTKVKKHTLNPVFEECLKFHISLNELETRTLWLTVWHSDMFGRNDFLGEVMMALENKVFDEPTPKWYNLQERTEPFEDMLSFKGDIIVCLKFLPPDMSVHKKGKRSRGTLHVLVKEAKSLIAVKANGASDPFCKSYLLPDKGRSSKQKTPVAKRTVNPVWNHTFVYEDVTLQELAERCLELTVWDHDRLASNEFLGGVRFSLGTGKHYGKPVDWMDATGKELTLWKSMLERPNFWVEGCLSLRPSLDGRTS